VSDHLDTFGGEHLVEAGGELCVAVPDEELKGPTLLGEIACEVAGNLGDKEGGRMIGDPKMWTTRLWSSMTNST
jgi:hypothetical protein